MPERAGQIADFIKRAGWSDAGRVLLAGDASARKYHRLTNMITGQTAVLMDAPPAKGETTEPFLRVAEQLLQRGLSAPKIIAQDQSLGLILLEDLGDDLFCVVCEKDPKAESLLYESAVDVLAELGTPAHPVDLPPYTPDIYLDEARLVTQWYLPAARAGTVIPEQLQAQFDSLILAACTAVSPVDPVFVLRDYHAENLLWLPDRSGLKRVGLLDFQDALAGHPAYDLVSLLEDARRDTTAELRDRMLKRYLQATGLDHQPFLQAFATLGAQRNLKIIGIFTRLCIRDQKPDYVDLIPRVWDHLMRDLSHPALSDLKQWVAQNIPPPGSQVRDNIRGAAQ